MFPFKRISIVFLIFSSILLVACSGDNVSLINDEMATEEAMKQEAQGEEATEETTAEEETEQEPEEVGEETEQEPEEEIGTEFLIWSDEFDGDTLDIDKWSYQRGGWNGANVQNCYIEENSMVSDGTLKITAKYEPNYDCFGGAKDFTSGFIQTKDRVSWTYGYFEARVKVPASNSTWPAFWLSPQDPVYGEWPLSGEIDVFEIKGHDMTKSHGTAHWGESRTNRRQKKGTYEFEDASQWHVYAVDWVEGELNFFIDSEYYHTINDFKAPNATTHPGPFNIDFYIRLNMAVGGDYLNEPHNDAMNNLDQLPAVMEVDYVRVYSQNPNN